jgi:hypothetical protein
MITPTDHRVEDMNRVRHECRLRSSQPPQR